MYYPVCLHYSLWRIVPRALHVHDGTQSYRKSVDDEERCRHLTFLQRFTVVRMREVARTLHSGEASANCKGWAVAPVVIVPYRESWVDEFADIAERIQEATGNWAVRIDHIGSTSVPGLAAKDVIDIQIGVRTLDLTAEVMEAMTGLGYVYRQGMRDHRPPGAHGPGADWEKQFFHASPEMRETHIHVRVVGRPNWRYALLFRDYLRANPQARDAYAELKRRLAAHPGMTRDEYPDIKDPACDLIYVAAEAWAGTVDWHA